MMVVIRGASCPGPPAAVGGITLAGRAADASRGKRTTSRLSGSSSADGGATATDEGVAGPPPRPTQRGVRATRATRALRRTGMLGNAFTMRLLPYHAGHTVTDADAHHSTIYRPPVCQKYIIVRATSAVRAGEAAQTAAV